MLFLFFPPQHQVPPVGSVRVRSLRINKFISEGSARGGALALTPVLGSFSRFFDPGRESPLA